MAGIRGLAIEVRAEKATTQDVTEEYSDTQTQIASLEVSRAQLLELMKRTGSVDELLKVQQQADQVRLQIDRAKGRATALERLSSLASIGVTAQLASTVLEQDYTTAVATIRRSEAQRAGCLRRSSVPARQRKRRVELRKARDEQGRIADDLQLGAADSSPDRLMAAILRANDLSVRLKTLQDRASQASIALPSVSQDEETVMAQVPGCSLIETRATVRRAWESSLRLLADVVASSVYVWWILLPAVGGIGAISGLRRRRTR